MPKFRHPDPRYKKALQTPNAEVSGIPYTGVLCVAFSPDTGVGTCHTFVLDDHLNTSIKSRGQPTLIIKIVNMPALSYYTMKY